MCGTFGEFITGFSNGDVENQLFDSDLSHGVLLFSFLGWLCRDFL